MAATPASRNQEFTKVAKESTPFSCYVQAVDAMNRNEPEKAKALLIKLLKSKDVQIKHNAMESLAKVYLQEGHDQKSYNLLLKADHQFLKEGKCLLCKLAFERKNYELVSKYSREIYDLEPSFEVATLNSKTFACLRESALAGAWLLTASQFGEKYKQDVRNILLHPSYDFVKNEEAFKQYAEEMN